MCVYAANRGVMVSDDIRLCVRQRMLWEIGDAL
jgi:hypothetical protein